MQVLLSIVIPSNNRTELLDEAVKSIFSEPAFDGRCEICISDNSSGDATEQLVALKYSRAKNVVYRRSLDAPSLDENVNQVVSLAGGKYVWFFGDDDLIVPGFLSELLDYLQKFSPEIIVPNSRSFQNSGILENLRVPETSLRIYSPFDDDQFLVDLGGYLTYVGCIIIRKTLWAEYFRPEMVGTYFAHIDTVYRAKIGRSAHFLPQPGISMRLHSQTWTGRHFEIWNIFFPAVIWGLYGYSDKAKQSVISRHPLKSLKRILASRAYGHFNLKIWRTVLMPSIETNGYVRWFGLLISVLPRDWFRLFYVLFIRICRRNHSREFSPDLALAQLARKVK
jgi:glycosyltransferase involved in cell wall biosynthesis